MGVVDSTLGKTRSDFSWTGVGPEVLSISSSLTSASAGCWAVSFRVRPKPLPKSEPPPPGFGFSLSCAVLGSALKVLPRTKGLPKGLTTSFLAGGGNEVSESIDTSGAFAAKAPEEPDPKTLPLEGVEPPAREANPPLLAKLAKPPDAGDPDPAALPKTLPGVCATAAKPVWPKAGFAAGGDAVAQGDAFWPRPPNCPNADGDPNVGVAVAGLLPKVFEPKADTAPAVEPVAHGEDLAPSAEAPPKAGAALLGVPKGLARAGAGAPNGFGLLAAGVPNTEGADVVEEPSWAAPSPATSPG